MKRCSWKRLGSLNLLLAAAVLLLSDAACSAEFIVNGSLSRALAGGNRCETSANAFYCWTLTPENGGGTNYNSDEFWPDTRLCGCSGVPCQIYPQISQTFGISGGGPYTLTWEQKNDQEDCSSRTGMWGNMTAVGTVYYFQDAAMTLPCSPASEDTGNVTSAARGVWASIALSNTGHAPLNGAAPADCRYINVVIKGLSKTNTCDATGGVVRAWTEIRNVSFTSTAFTKTSGPDPIISQQPSSQVMIVGEQATFTVVASGPGTLGYQWQKNTSGGSFSDIGGAVNSSYTTPALVAGDDGNQYRCKVSNACTSVYSDAATLTVLAPTSAATVAEAKTHGDDTLIKLTDKAVSARTSSAYWVQDITPPNGIRINSTAYPSPGSRVTIVGTLASTGGERRIEPVLERWGTPGAEVRPYFMLTRSLGGSDLNSHSPGIPGSYGPNNIGLLVKIYGTVKNVGSNYYYLDDGAGLKDGTTTDSEDNVGVRVMAPPGSLATNDRIPLVGISSVFLDGSQPLRALIPPGCSMPNSELPVGATAGTICEGQSTTITVGSTESDVTYQLRNSAGNVNVGAPVAGTGGTINLPAGILTTSTTFNVRATRNVGGCSVQLTQTKTITVNPLPNAGLAVGATQTQLEVGQSTNVTVANSQSGVNYQLRKNSDNSNVGSPVAGNGGTINLPTGTYSTTGVYVYNVLATNAATGCSQQLAQTVTITVGSLGNLTGKVMNALGEPLNGALVSVADGAYTTTTGTDGTFTLSNVVAGTYSMTASAETYQSHTWERVVVTANQTNPVPHFYLPHTWSKIGWHIQSLQPTGLGQNFLIPIHNCGKTCQMVKGMGNLGVSDTAASYCPGSFSVGRVNEVNGVGDIQAFDENTVNTHTPEQWAAWVYYGPAGPSGDSGLRRLMRLNPNIHVWEINNEWDGFYDWQADYSIAMMNLAEPDGYRIACFSSSTGTPSLDPDYKWGTDTRTELENLARVCARAKAHGGHMLALHEYSLEGTLYSQYMAHPGDLVLRYRRYHDYLESYTATDDPANGWIGADCPIIITECAGNCSASNQAIVADMGWYDSMVRQDSYLLGVATWNIGPECDNTRVFSDMAAYICAN